VFGHRRGGDGPVDYARLHELLGLIRPSGPTSIGSALEAAIKKLPAPGTTGLILLVSDLQTEEFDANAAVPKRGGVVALGSGYVLAG
jgi:hypothetical protein